MDALSTIDTRCCATPDPFASKKDLDAQWMPKVNDHLAKHGLIAQLHAFWNYNGQSSTPMMQMLVSSQSSHPSKSHPRPPFFPLPHSHHPFR